MANKISTITELRNDLLDAYEQLRNGTIKYEQAKEVSNMAGKIIKSAKSQLDYNNYMDIKADIPFFS